MPVDGRVESPPAAAPSAPVSDVTQAAKAHFNAIGRRYHAITDTEAFRHYLERRREYLRDCFVDGKTDHDSSSESTVSEGFGVR